MMRLGGALLCLLVVAACSTPSGPEAPEVVLPEEGDLTPLPVYPLTRGDWDTSATCTVYPVFRSEGNIHSIGMVTALHQGLAKNRYSTVALPVEGYTSLDRLTAVDRIIRPSRLTFRQTILRGNRIAADAHLLVEVWSPDDVEGRRIFEVWARDIVPGTTYSAYGPLYEGLVKNLLSLDTFRAAMELEPTQEPEPEDR